MAEYHRLDVHRPLEAAPHASNANDLTLSSAYRLCKKNARYENASFKKNIG